MNFKIFSYIGLFFAIVYRVPQIVHIIKTRKAEDISTYSVHSLNGAYLSFITYLVGTGKIRTEWVLCLYYLIGMVQNLIIVGLKKYYTPPEVDCMSDQQEVQCSIITPPTT
jgi:uncharacterized protein with PQ loop repeat